MEAPKHAPATCPDCGCVTAAAGLGYRYCRAHGHFRPPGVDPVEEARAYLVAIRPRKGER